jgi:uncharacterized NAD(P)/FAD-binding protein YdhS
MTAELRGSGWRSVLDSVRFVAQDIWRSLSLAERRRFLRHLRPYWEIHRHRIPPEIGSFLAGQQQNRLIEMHAGRVTAYREDSDAVEVSYRDRRSGDLRLFRIGRVVNCTGPELDCRRVDSPLLKDLLRRRMICPDPLFLGLDASEDGAVIDADGVASTFLYTLGPSRKGSLWETTAVPELRVQISQLADLLLGRHESAKSPRTESPPDQLVRPDNSEYACLGQSEA